MASPRTVEAENGAVASLGLKQVCKAGLTAGIFAFRIMVTAFAGADRVRYTLAALGALQLHAGQLNSPIGQQRYFR